MIHRITALRAAKTYTGRAASIPILVFRGILKEKPGVFLAPGFLSKNQPLTAPPPVGVGVDVWPRVFMVFMTPVTAFLTVPAYA